MSQKPFGQRLNFRHSITLAVVAGISFANPMAIPAQAVSWDSAGAHVNHEGKLLAFEVVSIREENSSSEPPGPIQIESTLDGYHMKGVPLMAVIQIAYTPTHGYHFNPNQIVGLPDWLVSIRYDIEAKVSDSDLPQWKDPALEPAMLRAMLQAMLADRFKFSAHRDSKMVPIYEMTVGRKGPKFKPTSGTSLAKIRQEHPNARALGSDAIVASGPNPGQQWLFGVTMPVLGEFLSTMAGRPIRDATGLTGKYDLKYQLELPPSTQNGNSATRPSDFFTLQIGYVVQGQLGLKLRAAEGPMESLVIDHVEKASQN